MFSNKDKSQKYVKMRKLEEVVLPNSKLKFCTDQLQNLNYIFNKRLEKDNLAAEDSVALAKSVTERLVQRLLCGAAQIDSRFSSKFLINSRFDQCDTNSTHLEYILRLDALSTPQIYENDEKLFYEILEIDKDCPAGYARIRLNGPTHKLWEEFINSFGFLRRDRIQAKLVELLAQAAGNDTPNSPLQVDESTMCGIPGKIVDPSTLYHILNLPAKHQVYYGPGGNVPRFPDTRDFRLAIVDEPNGIKLKVEFLSPALAAVSVKVTILVAIGLDSWPSTSEFPSRIILGHSDCLLHHQAAQTGMFLVGYGVHSSAWQIRLPCAEFILLHHYAPNSTVRTILDILYEVLRDINSLRRFQKPVSYKIINRYMLFTLLMEELEESSVHPFDDLVEWSPMFLSTLSIKLLDKAIIRLSSEFQPNYFFKKANLLVNPGHLSDDDFMTEASNLKNYLLRLFDESLASNRGNPEFTSMLISHTSEMNLLYKWKGLVENMMPPASTRGRRLGFSKNHKDIAHTQYTSRQLEYISLLLHGMLKVKQLVLNSNTPCYFEDHDTNYLEDIIYILIVLLEQARDQYLATANPNIRKNKSKIRAGYGECVNKLIELLKRDKELLKVDLNDDQNLVKTILKWLYKAMDNNKKYFAPILRPYLNNLFSTSYYVSYHLAAIKSQSTNDELHALSMFSELVNNGTITPAQGLMDSISKNWEWSKNMLEMVEKNTLRLVFIEDRKKIYRHILSLPSYHQKAIDVGSRTLGDHKKVQSIERKSTLPGRNYFNSLLGDGTKFSNIQHDILKNNSPLTLIFQTEHRLGQHRCAGDILKSMTAMHKLSVFQEATSSLPKEDQSKLMNIIDNIHTAKAKRSLTKRWSDTLPHSTKSSEDYVQKYTPKEESAGIRISPLERRKFSKKVSKTDTLLCTSRAARLREDNSLVLLQENFRLKSLVNRSESFK